MKNKNNCGLLWIILLVLCSLNIAAQPFAEDIRAFKKQDSIAFPPKQAILFVGSSSFTNWKDVQNYFPQFTIVNRGFGGSSISDVIRYADDIIFPYQPKQIVIYCGENDLAASDTVTGKMVYQRFVQLFTLIRNKMPGVPVAFISLKPSPSRWQLKDKMIAANDLVKKYLRKKKKTSFIDVYHKMLAADGTPLKEIFIQDNLHMNAKGYAIWKKIIAPYLKK
ncbi:GDSL-type esterase/lipase family protein [Ferruginibacter sp.]